MCRVGTALLFLLFLLLVLLLWQQPVPDNVVNQYAAAVKQGELLAGASANGQRIAAGRGAVDAAKAEVVLWRAHHAPREHAYRKHVSHVAISVTGEVAGGGQVVGRCW